VLSLLWLVAEVRRIKPGSDLESFGVSEAIENAKFWLGSLGIPVPIE
jgi:hypothetical protein